MASHRRSISASMKNSLAARQSHVCAGVKDYVCPLGNRKFDESGFHIDHIVELADGGDNNEQNLQALCPCCHAVKTQRCAIRRASGNAVSKPNIDEIPVLRALLYTPVDETTNSFLRSAVSWRGSAREFFQKKKIPFEEGSVFGQDCFGNIVIIKKLIVTDIKKLCSAFGIRRQKIKNVIEMENFTRLLEPSLGNNLQTQEGFLQTLMNDKNLQLKTFLASKGIPFTVRGVSYISGRSPDTKKNEILDFDIKCLADSLSKEVMFFAWGTDNAIENVM